MDWYNLNYIIWIEWNMNMDGFRLCLVSSKTNRDVSKLNVKFIFYEIIIFKT